MEIKSHYSIRQPQRDEREGIQKVSRELEQQFLSHLVKTMRSTVAEGEGPFQRSFAERIYRDQLDSHYVEQWSYRGGIGLGEIISNQLIERYFPHLKKAGTSYPPPGGAFSIQGPLSLESKQTGPMYELKTQSGGEGAALQFDFRRDRLSAETGLADVKAPWSGEIVARWQRASGEEVISMKHGNGFESLISYMGQRTSSDGIKQVLAGEVLGYADVKSAPLQWKVTKSAVGG